MDNASELWLKRNHKYDLAFRPLETALLKGVVDAIYTQSKPFQHLQEATGKMKAIEDLSRYPDWTLQVANIPAAITCSDVMAEKHPELAVTFMKGMIKVGRWANEHKHAAAAILDKQTFYLDVEDTYRGIKDMDLVPNLSPQNLASVEIGKDFMLSHGYIKKDFDVQKWAAPEFLEQAAKELLEEQWKKATTAKLPRDKLLESSAGRVALKPGDRTKPAVGRRPSRARNSQPEACRLDEQQPRAAAPARCCRSRKEEEPARRRPSAALRRRGRAGTSCPEAGQLRLHAIEGD